MFYRFLIATFVFYGLAVLGSFVATIGWPVYLLVAIAPSDCEVGTSLGSDHWPIYGDFVLGSA